MALGIFQGFLSSKAVDFSVYVTKQKKPSKKSRVWRKLKREDKFLALCTRKKCNVALLNPAIPALSLVYAGLLLRTVRLKKKTHFQAEKLKHGTLYVWDTDGWS